MTEQQLVEIEQRWEKATLGPWVADMRPVATECGECGEYAYEVPGVIRRKSDGCGIVDVQESEKQNENAAAIASAPTDISLLLAEVRRLKQSNKARECCGNCKNHKYNQRFGLSCPVHGDRIHPSNWCELWISGKEEAAGNG